MNNNYKLIKDEYIYDIKSYVNIYEHKAGAKIICVKNNNVNRVFSVTFKTPPENDKGIAHALEHCVLCGSKNYKLNDTFNELEKGTVNTYLNAITYDDMTIFPAASTVEKHFRLLLDVYMDSVFFPLIYDYDYSFIKEGKGVVYNEMKGFFSSPINIINYNIMKKLYEDTFYKYCSAGIPEEIKKLSYNEFLKFHKKYYHPSNCIIYLYGDLDFDEYLSMIDYKYLSKFKKIDFKLNFISQKNKKFKNGIFYSKYANDCYIQFSSICENVIDDFSNFNMKILFKILLEDDNSILKRILYNENICGNVLGKYNENLFQPMFSIILEKSKCKLKYFENLLYKSLNIFMKKGVEKKYINYIINSMKFFLREGDFGYKPRGLYYNLLLVRSFVYGNGSIDCLKFESLFKNAYDTDYSELAKSVFFKDNYMYGILKPEKYVYKAEFEDNIKHKKKITSLGLSGVKKNTEMLKSEIYDYNGVIGIYSSDKYKCNEINYIDILFNTENAEYKYISYIGFFCYALKKADKFKDYMKYYLGGFDVIYKSYKKDNDYCTFVNFKLKFLTENKIKIFEIFKNIIFTFRFNDKKEIWRLLCEYKLLKENSIKENGHLFALTKGLSYISEKYIYDDLAFGIEEYLFLNSLNINDSEKILNCINNLYECIVKKGHITICVTGEEFIYKDFINLFKTTDRNKKEKQKLITDNKNFNEAFYIDTAICFNAALYKIKNLGGDGKVINKIISSDYLWKKIRVENGAYETGSCFSSEGYFYAYSCRDLKIKNTYYVFSKIFDYLYKLKLDNEQLRQYIIGTLSQIDKPIKDSCVNDILLENYFKKITYEYLQKERDDIMYFDKNKFEKITDYLYELEKTMYICTLGNYEIINKNKSLFKITIKL